MKPAKTRTETKLIPEDDLKKVVAAIAAVPKAEVDAMESERPKKFTSKRNTASDPKRS